MPLKLYFMKCSERKMYNIALKFCFILKLNHKNENWYHCQIREINRSLLEKVEQILNRPIITKFHNSDDVHTATVELRKTKTRPASF